jgi:hypothetical protein
MNHIGYSVSRDTRSGADNAEGLMIPSCPSIPLNADHVMLNLSCQSPKALRDCWRAMA